MNFEYGMNKLKDTLLKYQGQNVVITRGNSDTIIYSGKAIITAIPVSKGNEDKTRFGVRRETCNLDMIIPASYSPQSGDKVTTASKVYVVTPTLDNIKRRLDGFDSMIRCRLSERDSNE